MAETKVSPREINNPYYWRGRRVAALNISGGSFALMPIDTEDYDPGNSFDVATNKGRYTALVAGLYHVNCRWSANGQNQIVVALYKNSVLYARGGHGVVAATNGVVYSDEILLAIGDYVEMYFYGDTSNAVEVTTGSQPYFSGYLVNQT